MAFDLEKVCTIPTMRTYYSLSLNGQRVEKERVEKRASWHSMAYFLVRYRRTQIRSVDETRFGKTRGHLLPGTMDKIDRR